MEVEKTNVYLSSSTKDIMAIIGLFILLFTIILLTAKCNLPLNDPQKVSLLEGIGNFCRISLLLLVILEAIVAIMGLIINKRKQIH